MKVSSIRFNEAYFSSFFSFFFSLAQSSCFFVVLWTSNLFMVWRASQRIMHQYPLSFDGILLFFVCGRKRDGQTGNWKNDTLIFDPTLWLWTILESLFFLTLVPGLWMGTGK